MEEVSLNGEQVTAGQSSETVQGRDGEKTEIGQNGVPDGSKEFVAPAAGMEFESYDDAYNYYNCYAREAGFRVRVKNSWFKRNSREKYGAVLCCSSQGFKRIKDVNRLRKETRTGCPAMLRMRLVDSKRWRVLEVALEHNHLLGTKAYKSIKKMSTGTKRKLQSNSDAEVRTIKLYRALVIDAGGTGNSDSNAREARTSSDNPDQLNLRKGDTQAIYNYLCRMQLTNPNFFYVMDLNNDGRLRNVFWIDAWCRVAVGYFSDVVFFDNTYLCNKYEIPLVAFIGMNHHGQSVLLGCGLLAGETMESYVWLFKAWLTCSSRQSPQTIITDRCKILQNAVAEVFPKSLHRFGLSHVMKKVPEKLGGLSNYDAIRKALVKAVYEAPPVLSISNPSISNRKMGSVTWFCLIALLLQSIITNVTAKQTYIVHMKHHQKPESYATHHDWYSANLQSLSSATTDSILYTYTTAYHGFAAALTTDEVESLRQSDSVISVYEESVYTLHTTRTSEFLGLEREVGLWAGRSPQQLNQASQDVIIGVLDTGVWPESKSFSDTGMPAVPSRWRGQCEYGADFDKSLCNKKLIGARAFSKGYRMAIGNYPNKIIETESPRDVDGHGTHTASTAAGSNVANASLLGYANGIARGMATHARIATYKVCWKAGCFSSDILAGMDHAITDGVDVLSMSLGGGSGPYHRDTIAIGAFTAMEMGILVSCSAGNSGPTPSSLANVAPWIMTVGAGTLDRDFPAYANLGDGLRFTGVSLYSGSGMGDKPVGIVYNKGGNSSSNLCLPGSLDPELVRGKVVLCDRGVNARVEKGAAVRDAGGVGMILANTEASGEELVADSHLVPAVAVGRKMGDVIREYVNKEANPTAVLSFGGTVLDVKPSPVVAAFSSRGPNIVTPQILKPDVIGPGVNILAGWSEAVGPTGLDSDTRKTRYNILSGTSMSCPHISGLAALLKAAHPDWSPSAIKSALMTTAYTQDNTNSPLRDAATGVVSNPWAYGSGHVDPHKAISPGLVYDLSAQDYIAFLCSLDYTIENIQTIVKHPNVMCSKKFSDPGQLNYPSFSVLFVKSRVVRYTRELTNVGAAGSTYEVAVNAPSAIGVTVNPTKLVFKNVGDKLRYTVTFVWKRGMNLMGRSAFGSISWNNAEHQVSSPVTFAWTHS